MTDEPTPSASRRIGLAALVIAATLILLVGSWTLVSRSSSAGDRPSPTLATPTPSAIATVAPSASPSPSATSASSEPSASASPSDASTHVLVGAGDIGDCATEHDNGTAALLDDIEGTVFTAGDNAYDNGTAKEFATCYDESWGRHKDRTRPAPGNHDWRTRRLSGYFGYFGDAARGPDGSSWYSYDIGSWHVIVLDSECDRVAGCDGDSEQGQWLAADLAASDATCTIAIWHKPRFSSGEHGNDRSVGPFWTQLYDAGADVVVNGHDHDYERFAPQDPSGRADPVRGIRQFVVGTGGTPLRTFRDPVANSELRTAVAYGVITFTLRAGSYDWEFIATDGVIKDRGTAFCR